MVTHTHTHTHIHTHTHTYTHDNYYNPRCAHAHRVLKSSKVTHAAHARRRLITLASLMRQGLMKALKCKPSAQFAYNYNINVLSKCSNIISHRLLIFEGRHNDHRSSKVGTSIIRRSTHRSSIFESRHINRRRSTHRSSIFEGRHIGPRSLKVDTSIFEDRRRKHRTDNPTLHRHSDNSSPNIVHHGAP